MNVIIDVSDDLTSNKEELENLLSNITNDLTSKLKDINSTEASWLTETRKQIQLAESYVHINNLVQSNKPRIKHSKP